MTLPSSGNAVAEVPPAGTDEGGASSRRRLYAVPDAAYELGISTRKCWTLVYSDRLATVWLDGRRLVTAEALDAFVATLSAKKAVAAA